MHSGFLPLSADPGKATIFAAIVTVVRWAEVGVGFPFDPAVAAIDI
jgi:hypothetical protein